MERLCPAVSLGFDGGLPRREVYWIPSVDASARAMPLARTIDQCAEALRETLRAHLSGDERPWADLTGGVDSRLIAAALVSCGIPFVANTDGDDAQVDVQLARRVAAASGLEWHQFALPTGWAPEASELNDAEAWGDGALEFVQLAAVLWGQQLRGRRARRLMTGSGGGHVSARPRVQEFVRAGRSRTVNLDRLLAMRYLPPIRRWHAGIRPATWRATSARRFASAPRSPPSPTPRSWT
ncbi:MAG TPA: asparagine synthase-related protein [Thermoleophilaceae bacterium]|nr:asparagine synthase-related protein [Thermoleophilaceae bacterium]